MRIISGKYRAYPLVTAEGKTTRPTSDFNREVIFSMHPEYEGCRVLDLFAGSGSFGLEALSRGALYVDFVEFSSVAISVLIQNINKLKCSNQCHIHRKRVEKFLRDAPLDYDVIFLDPPYAKGLVASSLELLSANTSLKQGAIIIIEHSPKEEIPPSFQPYLIRQKSGKSTAFSLMSLP